MKKETDAAEVKEIKKLAEALIDKPVLSQADLDKLNNKLDTVLAQYGVFRRYFRRLS